MLVYSLPDEHNTKSAILLWWKQSRHHSSAHSPDSFPNLADVLAKISRSEELKTKRGRSRGGNRGKESCSPTQRRVNVYSGFNSVKKKHMNSSTLSSHYK